MPDSSIYVIENSPSWIVLSLSFDGAITKPSTFEAASSLISTGIDFSDICKRVNDTKDELQNYSEEQIHEVCEIIKNIAIFIKNN